MGEESDARGLEAAAAAFAAGLPVLELARHGGGHIHASWRLCFGAPAEPRQRLLQRLNVDIFRDPVGLMDNVVRVTTHLRQKLLAAGIPDCQRRSLAPVRDCRGGWLYRDDQAGFWRAFEFVAGARSAHSVEDTGQAFEAARAFASFAAQVADLPGPPLRVTLPHFHDLGRRVADFDAALGEDALGRAAAVRDDVGRLRRAIASLERALPGASLAALPRRIAHHDCKLDNLLLDERSGEALCVIDLDTVMPGTLLSDFGGLVRSATCRAAEDERDLERIDFDLELFEAVARGYLSGAGQLLVSAERRALAPAGALITLLDATRFLTDHLAGDVYFRIQRENHNLDRARSQLRLAERMLERGAETAAIVESLAPAD